MADNDSKNLLAALTPLAEAIGELIGKEVGEELAEVKQELQEIKTIILALSDQNSIPSPSPSDPTDPTPPDEKPGESKPIDYIPLTLQINDFNGQPDFSRGVWTGTPAAVRVSVPVTNKSAEALAIGAKVKLADGKVREVIQLETIGTNHSVTMTGGELDPSVVGHPNNLSTAPADAVDDAPDTSSPTTPSPKPDNPSPAPVGGKGKICINLGLGQGGDIVLPGKNGTNYFFPVQEEFDLIAKDGFPKTRCGFLWERALRGVAGKGTVDIEHAKLMIQSAKYAKKAGVKVLWDMHNYSGHSTTNHSKDRQKIGSSAVPITALGDDWATLLEYLMQDSDFQDATYGFDLMNEPIIPWSTWKPALQHCVNRVAEMAPGYMVICEGINYSNTTNWVTNNPDMHTITHPQGKQYLEFHGHLYLDNGQDGFWTDAVETKDNPDLDIGIKRLSGFLEWGRQHGVKTSIGESMVPGIYPNYIKAFDRFLEYGVDNGVDTYLFFYSRHAGANWHNVYLDKNAPTLEVIRKNLKRAA